MVHGHVDAGASEGLLAVGHIEDAQAVLREWDVLLLANCSGECAVCRGGGLPDR